MKMNQCNRTVVGNVELFPVLQANLATSFCWYLFLRISLLQNTKHRYEVKIDDRDARDGKEKEMWKFKPNLDKVIVCPISYTHTHTYTHMLLVV